MRLRQIEIKNFRIINQLSWAPMEGINCLIGPGDSGKSTVLDAIDFCLGTKKTIQFNDSDFHNLNIDLPIEIFATIGDLDDSLKSLDTYGHFLRGFDKAAGKIEDEPHRGQETVLTIRLFVDSDLEPSWTLYSERAEAAGQERYLSWKDRQRLSPARIGTISDHNLSWKRGSVLNRVSEEKADTASALLNATRETRAKFGEEAKDHLKESLKIVDDTIAELGISEIDEVTAMLDAQSISFSGGTVSLHSKNGIPLRSLGTGSTRLLTAGLQRKVAEREEATVLIVDELELGLEPHRIMRLLDSLGAKEEVPPMQVFMTTHSPVVLTELSGTQLFIVRRSVESHEVRYVGASNAIQGTVRTSPAALLAAKILVCEGASEVGFMRGFDQFIVSQGKRSYNTKGVSLVDGGGVNKLVARALAFQSLGYPTAILRDDDAQPNVDLEKEFENNGGTIVKWQAGRALEDELFLSLPENAVHSMLELAIEKQGEEIIKEHISTASKGKLTLENCRAEKNEIVRNTLGRASKYGWFKTVGLMEEVTRNIVAPNFAKSDQKFVTAATKIIKWTRQ